MFIDTHNLELGVCIIDCDGFTDLFIFTVFNNNYYFFLIMVSMYLNTIMLIINFNPLIANCLGYFVLDLIHSGTDPVNLNTCIVLIPGTCYFAGKIATAGDPQEKYIIQKKLGSG